MARYGQRYTRRNPGPRDDDYRDYNDRYYTDHYRDNDYDDYHDSDMIDNGRRFTDPPFDDGLIEKIVRLGPLGSVLLHGDSDGLSKLFGDSKLGDNGAPIDVLPKLLNGGWRVRSIVDGLVEGEKLIVLWRPTAKGR